MIKKRRALLIAALDGIASIYSGVGVVVFSVFEGFGYIEKTICLDDFDVHAAVPYFDQNTNDFSLEVLKRVKIFCNSKNGKVHYLPSLSHGASIPEIWRGQENIKTIDQWNSLSIALSSLVLSLINMGYDSIVVITHDTLFANTSKYLSFVSGQVELCWIPHSLSLFFDDELMLERFEFERKSIQNIINSGHKIGFISNQTKEYLISEFKVPNSHLISFYSGINIDSQKYTSLDTSRLNLMLSEIPHEKKIIFSWGRCVYQKGIDVIIRSFNSIYKKTDKYHLVLFCPTSNSTPDYLKLIKNLLNRLPDDSYTMITEYDNHTPIQFLKLEKTEFVILASRFEGFGLIAIEAALICPDTTKIIYTSLPTFNEVLVDRPNTYSIDNLNENTMTKLFFEIENKVEYRKNANRIRLNEQYNLLKNHSKGLEQLIKH